MTKKTVIKTIQFPISELTNHKKQLLQMVIDESQYIACEVAKRMPSIPIHRWDKSTDSVYYNWVIDLRENIYSKCAEEAIKKVRGAFASWHSCLISWKKNDHEGDKPGKPHFDGNGNWARWHNQSFNVLKNNDTFYFKLPTIKNGKRYDNVILPVIPSDYANYFLSRIVHDELDYGALELHNDNGGFVIHLPIKKSVEIYSNPETFVGIDLGLRNIATMASADKSGDIVPSSVHLWKGSEAGHVRNRFYEYRKALGKKGLLAKIRESKGREHRWMDNVNHNISRDIINRIAEFDKPVIIMENLTNIGERIDESKGQNRLLHNWTFYNLQTMIEYKALEKGISTKYVDAKYTSLRCNRCGIINKKNRPNGGIIFKCINCGYEVNADVNAAMNLAKDR